jgi:hypothetical protein
VGYRRPLLPPQLRCLNMQLYPKTSAELVLDLIAVSNPGLPFPLTTDAIFVGPPTTIPVVPPSIANTSARVSSKPGSLYGGSKVVSYRRVNLTDLFKNVTPNVRKYSAAGESGSNPFTVYTLLPFLNDVYGLKLTTDDVSDGAFPAYSTITEGGVQKRVSSFTMTAKATSVAFTGSVVIRTQAGQRELASAITKGELPGRLYPGGNDFVTVAKDRLDIIGYGIDFSELMNGIPVGGSIGRLSYFQNGYPIGTSNPAVVGTAHWDIVSAINQAQGLTLKTGAGGATGTATPAERWNLNGATTLTVTLPNAAYPEANSKDYNRLAVITASAANTWAVGRIYLHYNI